MWFFFSEESAYRVLTNESEGGGHVAGVPIVLKAYELHKDNAEVVESIVSLVMELSEYGEKKCWFLYKCLLKIYVVKFTINWGKINKCCNAACKYKNIPSWTYWKLWSLHLWNKIFKKLTVQHLLYILYIQLNFFSNNWIKCVE